MASLIIIFAFTISAMLLVLITVIALIKKKNNPTTELALEDDLFELKREALYKEEDIVPFVSTFF